MINTILAYIGIILVAVIGVVLFLAILSAIYAYRDAQSMLSKLYNAKTMERLSDINTQKLNMNLVRLQTTGVLLQTIEGIVIHEIDAILTSYEMLGKRYEYTNIESDVNIITSRVKSGLDSDLFSEEDIIISNDYLSLYIADYTTLELLNAAAELNERLL